MSGYATLCRPDRAFLWTDGAVADEDGRLIAIESKVWPVADEPLAITGRGPAGLSGALAGFLADAGVTADDMLNHGREIVQTFEGAEADRFGGVQHFDFVMVGWSAAERRSFVVVRSTIAEDGWLTGTEFSAPTVLPREAMKMRRALRFPRTLDDVDPAAYGLAIMEAMRRSPGLPEYGLGGRFVVGGHVVETIVSSTGVSSRTVQTWPDVIGEFIRPDETNVFPFDPRQRPAA